MRNLRKEMTEERKKMELKYKAMLNDLDEDIVAQSKIFME